MGPAGWGLRWCPFEMTGKTPIDLYAPARLRPRPPSPCPGRTERLQDGLCAYCHYAFTDIEPNGWRYDHVRAVRVHVARMADGDLHQSESRPGLRRVQLRPNATALPPQHGSRAGMARRTPHLLAPSPPNDLDQSARPGLCAPGINAGATPHRGNRADPVMDSAFFFQRGRPSR